MEIINLLVKIQKAKVIDVIKIQIYAVRINKIVSN